MGQFSYDALADLGHKVRIFDYKRSFLDKVFSIVSKSKEEKSATNKRLRKEINTFKPDLFLTIFGFDISIESLSYLRAQSIPTACWWINDPFQFHRSLKKAAHYDFIFSNSAESVEEYKKNGVSNALFLPCACAPKHHYHESTEVKKQDVGFAGDWSPERELLLTKLSEDGVDIKILGPWGKKIASHSCLRSKIIDRFFDAKEMATFFNQSIVTLNLHTWNGKFQHGVNPRLFEASASGTIQVCDFKNEIPNLFKPNKEIILFENVDDVTKITKDILSLPPEERFQIEKSARDRSIQYHTYKHRMNKIIKTTLS